MSSSRKRTVQNGLFILYYLLQLRLHFNRIATLHCEIFGIFDHFEQNGSTVIGFHSVLKRAVPQRPQFLKIGELQVRQREEYQLVFRRRSLQRRRRRCCRCLRRLAESLELAPSPVTGESDWSLSLRRTLSLHVPSTFIVSTSPVIGCRKDKVLPYISYRALGPELIQLYTGSQPTGGFKPSTRR